MTHELFNGMLAVEPRYLERLLPQLQRALESNGPMLAEPTAERKATFLQPTLQVVAGLELSQATGAKSQAAAKVMVVPLEGVLTKRSSWFGMGYRQVGSWLQQAFNDPEVSAVVLQVDSPGGTVDGNEELARMVATAPKPVRVFIDGMGASAAYRVASQAKGGITVNSASASIVGSIGTVQQHVDMSKALEAQGVKVTFMTADRSTHKMLGNPTEPLSDEALAYHKVRLNAANDAFVADVEAGRKGKLSKEEDVFTAKVYNGADAVKHGLADSIGTLSDAVREAAQMAAGISPNKSTSSNQTMLKTPRLGAALAALGFVASADAELQANSDTLAKAEEVLAASEQALATANEQLMAAQQSITALTTARDTAQTAVTTLTTEKTALTEQVQTLEDWKKQSEQREGPKEDERQSDGKPKAGYQLESEKLREQQKDIKPLI